MAHAPISGLNLTGSSIEININCMFLASILLQNLVFDHVSSQKNNPIDLKFSIFDG